MRILLLLLLAQPVQAERLSWFPRAHDPPRLKKILPRGPLAMTILGSMMASSAVVLTLLLAPAPQYQATTFDSMNAVYVTKWDYGRANYMELGIGLSLCLVSVPLLSSGSKQLEEGTVTVRF